MLKHGIAKGVIKLTVKKYKWNSIKRKHGHTIPWGYFKDPDDPDIFQPIPEQLDALERAKDFLLEKNCSSRDVARWLSEHTGVSLSHTGLIKRIRYDNDRFREQEDK